MDLFRNDAMTERNSIKESGILEQYVMGELSREERSKVDAILKEDEQLKAYVRTIENDLENVAFENAIEPPANTKKVVLAAIKQKINTDEADPKVVPISGKNERLPEPYRTEHGLLPSRQ